MKKNKTRLYTDDEIKKMANWFLRDNPTTYSDLYTQHQMSEFLIKFYEWINKDAQ